MKLSGQIFSSLTSKECNKFNYQSTSYCHFKFIGGSFSRGQSKKTDQT
jgi:hypothetical protein